MRTVTIPLEEYEALKLASKKEIDNKVILQIVKSDSEWESASIYYSVTMKEESNLRRFPALVEFINDLAVKLKDKNYNDTK